MMPVTIHTYSMDTFHGEAAEYVAKITAKHTGTEYCARCQGSHDTIEWKALSNPVMSAPKGARPSAIIAWGMCPTTYELIFVEAWEDTQP